MLKVLLKKQLMEVGAFVYQNKKTGKNRTGASLIGYCALLIGIYAYLGVIFYRVANSLCAPLTDANMDWLYYSIMGMMAMALGIFASVFNTFSALYQAKDNDLLLSMPIKPSYILISRMFGTYILGLFFELLVMIPAMLVYIINTHANALSVIGAIITSLVISVFVMSVSCILGYFIALINKRIKSKNFVTVLVSLGFLAIYFYFYSKAYALLQSIITNSAAYGEKVKKTLFPIYIMGKSATGDFLSVLLLILMVFSLMAIVYLVLAKSFLYLNTANKGVKKNTRPQKEMTVSSVNKALFKKELKRLTGSATYMMNCGLGTIGLLAAAVAVIIKGDYLRNTLITMLEGYEGYIGIMIFAVLCVTSTMNDLTAPSVSLEGKSIWIAQTLPVSPWYILKSKINMHLALTGIPLIICAVSVNIAMKSSLIISILSTLGGVLFMCFVALFGLILNLKLPNLNWQSETIAVKQSMSVMIALFGSWAVAGVLIAPALLIETPVSPTVYLAVAIAILCIMIYFMYAWLKTKGARIFSHLTPQ